MGVSKQLVIKALAKYLDQEQTSIAHQLMGKWDPYEETMSSMFEGENHLNKHHLPYPFFWLILLMKRQLLWEILMIGI